MNWLIENWSMLVVCIVILAVFFYAVYTKRANAKEWLKWAVTQAEMWLGSGTGQLKLRQVYEMFCKQFPWFATFVPFSTFSVWVDEALEWMKAQMSANGKIKSYVEGPEFGPIIEDTEEGE